MLNIQLDANRILVNNEVHEFADAAAAERRHRFIVEGMTWIGTPFRDCADIKGRNGGVDCAMSLTRCAVDTGLVPFFDPRPYPPQWHLHQSEERMVKFLIGDLGAKEVEEPRVGDVTVYRYGKCFSHSAMVVSSEYVLHAWFAAGMCLLSLRREPLLNQAPYRQKLYVRPKRHFEVWGG